MHPKTLVMFPRRDVTIKYNLTRHYPDDQHLLFEGRWKNDLIQVKMKVCDVNQFRLVNRGYHWINEYPYNR